MASDHLRSLKPRKADLLLNDAFGVWCLLALWWPIYLLLYVWVPIRILGVILRHTWILGVEQTHPGNFTC